MRVYEVEVSFTAYARIAVEAESEEEAEDLVWEQALLKPDQRTVFDAVYRREWDAEIISVKER